MGDYRVIFDGNGHILFIEELITEGRPTRRYSMTPVKEKIIGAVTVMADSDAESFWRLIEKKYAPSWEDIKEEEPDSIDIKCLRQSRMTLNAMNLQTKKI